MHGIFPKILQRQPFTHQVYMASKIQLLSQFYVLSKTEKSRCVTKSRLICVGDFKLGLTWHLATTRYLLLRLQGHLFPSNICKNGKLISETIH
jgi:hypothetical protein